MATLLQCADMSKTVVAFNMPVVFADEGIYEVSLNNKIAKITIELISNDENLSKIAGLKMSGAGRMVPDPHGVANLSKVTIEIPYIVDTDEEQDANFQAGRGLAYSVKAHCVMYLNRLIAVIRYATIRAWVPFVSEHDIIHLTYIAEDDAGKKRAHMSSDFGSGLTFPLASIEQSQVQSRILEMALQETAVPAYYGI